MIALLSVPKVALTGLLVFSLLLSAPFVRVTEADIEAAIGDKEFMFEFCEAIGRGVLSDLWTVWNDTDDGLSIYEAVGKALRDYRLGRGSPRVRQLIKEHLRRR